MGVISTPLKNDIAMQKDLFRLAASLYAQTSDTYSTAEAQLQMVKCVFVNNENSPLDYDGITSELLLIYKYHISEDEIISVIKRNKRIFSSVFCDGHEGSRLTDDAYKQAVEVQKQNIDYYIDEYIQFARIPDGEKCKEAIHRYLYELTTTNINSYRVLLIGKYEETFSDKELSVNVDDLTPEEKEYVHNFLIWDNDEKNVALGNIVYCCLEYCLLVNGDAPNSLISKTIRKREVYLDTNVIFRALGINGMPRKRVVIAFLDKCRQAKIKLVISMHTKREFRDTIAHYISEIAQYPRGSIYVGAYEQLADYTIFSLYDEWSQRHKGLSLKYFSTYINSLYATLISKYNIIDDERIPSDVFDSDDFKTKRNAYSASIKESKQAVRQYYYEDYDGYTKSNSHDATVIRYVEVLRQRCDESKDIFLVSSDKALRYWDMTRKENPYPVVVYPSQLFLILIKLCGRSESDFDSFVSFINIRTNTKQLSPEQANIVLAGISSITEDIRTQEVLVSAVFDDDFQNIIQHSNTDSELYQNVQTYSQNYLDEQLKAKDETIVAVSDESAAKDVKIENAEKHAQEMDELLDVEKRKTASKEKELEEKREHICKYAERKILPWYIFKWYISPFAVVLYSVLFVVFIALQFFFCEADWNLATKLFELIATTTFGKNVEGYIAVIDAATFAVLSVILVPQFWVKPWDAEKRTNDKQAKIAKYIEKNKLC